MALNGACKAFNRAMELAESTGSVAPPKHLLNAPTRMMEDQGFGEGYVYDHNAEGGFSGQDCFSLETGRHDLYVPTGRGRETAFAERMQSCAPPGAPTTKSPAEL